MDKLSGAPFFLSCFSFSLLLWPHSAWPPSAKRAGCLDRCCFAVWCPGQLPAAQQRVNRNGASPLLSYSNIAFSPPDAGKTKGSKLKGEETAVIDQVAIVGSGKDKGLKQANIKLRFNRNPVIGECLRLGEGPC
jgi:hypothetical protein